MPAWITWRQSDPFKGGLIRVQFCPSANRSWYWVTVTLPRQKTKVMVILFTAGELLPMQEEGITTWFYQK